MRGRSNTTIGLAAANAVAPKSSCLQMGSEGLARRIDVVEHADEADEGLSTLLRRLPSRGRAACCCERRPPRGPGSAIIEHHLTAFAAYRQGDRQTCTSMTGQLALPLLLARLRPSAAKDVGVAGWWHCDLLLSSRAETPHVSERTKAGLERARGRESLELDCPERAIEFHLLASQAWGRGGSR